MLNEEEKQAIERLKKIIKDNNEIIKESRKNRRYKCYAINSRFR